MTTNATAKFTDDELELLSPAEREGMLDPDLVDDEPEPSPDDADPGEDPKDPPKADEPDPKPDPEPKPGEDADPPAKVDNPEPDPAADTPPAKPQAAHPPGPAPYTAPADIDKKIADLRAEQDALAEQFDAGDLTAVEFNRKRAELDDQLFDHRMAKQRAAQSFEDRRHHWDNVTVSAFLGEHDEYEPGSALFDSLDLEVRKLQVGEFKADPFDPAIMEKAHERVMASWRKVNGKAADPDKPADPADPGKQREIPPNLGGLPSAGEDDLTGNGGQFAYLDRLMEKQPLQFEKELAKLTDAQREQYLASN